MATSLTCKTVAHSSQSKIPVRSLQDHNVYVPAESRIIDIDLKLKHSHARGRHVTRCNGQPPSRTSPVLLYEV